MGNTKGSWIAILPFVILSSCQEVIDFELKGTEPMIVIEGTITNEAGPYYVAVSKSQHFGDSTHYITVNNATVIISDNVSRADTLYQVLDGLYQTRITVGVEGRTYMLAVFVDGKTYTSICTMPYRVELDTLIVEDDPTTNTGFALTPVYTDPKGISNFYRFNAFEDNSHIPLIRVRRDKSTDGFRVSQPVGFENYYNQGDSATLEMMCIDERVYQYLFGLSEAVNTGLNAAASPGNPPSNIGGGCLGYFSAHTVQRRSIRIH
jgi:hypothetical protein